MLMHYLRIMNQISSPLFFLSFSPQCTSAPKKSCSYPSLISTSLLQKKNPQIDSKINHEKMIYDIHIYIFLISLDITPLNPSGPHGSPTSTTSPLDPCLYLSCECVALSPFWVLLAFLTCHTENQTPVTMQQQKRKQ